MPQISLENMSFNKGRSLYGNHYGGATKSYGGPTIPQDYSTLSYNKQQGTNTLYAGPSTSYGKPSPPNPYTPYLQHEPQAPLPYQGSFIPNNPSPLSNINLVKPSPSQ